MLGYTRQCTVKVSRHESDKERMESDNFMDHKLDMASFIGREAGWIFLRATMPDKEARERNTTTICRIERDNAIQLAVQILKACLTDKQIPAVDVLAILPKSIPAVER